MGQLQYHFRAGSADDECVSPLIFLPLQFEENLSLDIVRPSMHTLCRLGVFPVHRSFVQKELHNSRKLWMSKVQVHAFVQLEFWNYILKKVSSDVPSECRILDKSSFMGRRKYCPTPHRPITKFPNRTHSARSKPCYW